MNGQLVALALPVTVTPVASPPGAAVTASGGSHGAAAALTLAVLTSRLRLIFKLNMRLNLYAQIGCQ